MSESRSLSEGIALGRDGTPSDRSIREAHVLFSDTDFEAVGISELVSAWRSARLRHLEMLACNGTDAIVQISVERPLDDTRLSSLEHVGTWSSFRIAVIHGNISSNSPPRGFRPISPKE